jgi:hypothetical protein
MRHRCFFPRRRAAVSTRWTCSERGLDVNYRESGDNTYGLHWVAAKVIAQFFNRPEMVRILQSFGGSHSSQNS